MAKKKSESAVAPKAAAKKEPTKKPAAMPSGDMPSINTSAAASAAAALVGNRVNLAGGGGARPVSAAFKAMKQNLVTPSAGVANLLPQTGGAKKSNAPFEKSKQVGHNQTFGADVNRSGVPRRTGGG